MFQLVVIEDTVHLVPTEFSKPMLTAVTDVLNEKYLNKVVPDIGLCIALYDVLEVGEPRLHQGSASQHASVEFRLVVFKPFVGEILTGTIMSSDSEGLRISLGFFDELYVPKTALQTPSAWNGEEKLWVWNVTEDDALFFDLDNEARFRVMSVEYAKDTAPPSLSGAEATDTEPAMRITAAVDKEGLGLLQWWPADDMAEGEGEGEEEEYYEEAEGEGQ